MNTFDVDALLIELDPHTPCGPNLEYDADFVGLELAAQEKPDVQYGQTITAAVPPDWKSVRKTSLALLERSRDLRVAMTLLKSSLALQGFAGLADSLRLIERLLEERWDTVHPELDPDDDLDPTLRINSLAELADTNSVLKTLKDTSILMLPILGSLTLRVLEIASGEIAPADGQEKVSVASLEAALRDVDDVSLQAGFAAISRSYDSASTIEALLVRQVGSAQALNLDVLKRGLRSGRDFLSSQQALRNPGATPVEELAGESLAEPTAVAVAAPPVVVANGEITNRDDVLRVLEKLLKYYHKHEPSSPVPLLLKRAQWLVPKSFMEIMEDLAPESVAQLMAISGNHGAQSD